MLSAKDKQEKLLMLRVVRGAVSELSEDDQKSIKALKEVIKGAVKIHGDHGYIALTLAAFEIELGQ